MTYITRRMNTYTRSQVPNPSYDLEKPFMLRNTGAQGVGNASDFSFMADFFLNDAGSRMGHVPGVNVLYLDGHVGFFADETDDGSILYAANGMSAQHSNENNWIVDNIWMRIDRGDDGKQ